MEERTGRGERSMDKSLNYSKTAGQRQEEWVWGLDHGGRSISSSSRNFTAEVVRFSVFRKAEGKSLCLVFILIRSSWLTELLTGFRTQPSGSLDLMPLKHRPLNPGSTSRTTEPS